MSLAHQDIAWMEIGELAAGIRTRAFSALEVTQAMLQRIAAFDPHLHAYCLVTPELALAQAAAADARQARGEPLGALHGVPIALKDLCFTQGIATAAGMPMHRGHIPDHDATVTRRLREAGAVLLGKLEMTEGAYSVHHPEVTAPVNPWAAELWPGVSSSGPGVATAAGLCFGSIGSDTGGSIRFPSAANAVTGLKPTWGRVSRHGAVELAASLDHLGPMCRSAADCGRMLGVMAGADPFDPTALPDPVPDYLSADIHRLDGLRIGVDASWLSTGVDSEVQAGVQAALDVLCRLGAQAVPVTVPDSDALVATWVALCGIEAAVAHERDFPARRAAYGPVLAGLLDEGRALSALDYQRILLRRADFTGRMRSLMADIDLLISPAIPLVAPTAARLAALREEPGYRVRWQRFTVPADMTGQPTLTMPSGFTAQGIPTAVQLTAGHLGEAVLIRAGRAFQGVTDWHRRHPDASRWAGSASVG